MNGLLPDLNSELMHTSNLLLNISDISNDIYSEKNRKISDQMKLNTQEKHGERYPPDTERTD